MKRLLCTIGFTGKTAEEFFTLLSDAGVQQVIDVRQNRSGQLSGFSKHPDLSFFLRKIAGIEYLHEVMKERGVPASLDMTSWSPKVSLLCSEPGPEKCHRRLVAELLAGYWREQGDAVEIRHLISSRQKPAKPRRKSVGLAP